jgi:hypothetical protein
LAAAVMTRFKFFDGKPEFLWQLEADESLCVQQLALLSEPDGHRVTRGLIVTVTPGERRGAAGGLRDEGR